MNPEKLLDEVATAIKHRCISSTGRWHIVYYYDRVCCVPSHENVPPKIILGEFTAKDVQEGFSVNQWDRLKTKLVELYKELHK